METPFGFEKYRKNLADKLNEKRTGGVIGKKEAKYTLAGAQTTDIYESSKTLHGIKNRLDKSMVRDAKEAVEVEDDPAVWDVQDVSAQIPRTLRPYIDALALQRVQRRSSHESGKPQPEPKLDELIDSVKGAYPSTDRAEFTKAVVEFLDKITNGDFSDVHNLHHTIGWQWGGVLRTAPFDRYSPIEGGRSTEEKKNSFWVNGSGDNASYRGGSLDKPAIILSPYALASRRFIENAMEISDKELLLLNEQNYGIRNEARVRALFLCAERLQGSNLDTHELQFKFNDATMQHPPNWMDISSTLVDLRVGKVWQRKQSQEEIDTVNHEIQDYRAKFAGFLAKWSARK